jgi:tetratricopeptide (TPR) repeat protein
LDDALEAALKALSLDSSDYDAHWRLAVVYLHRKQFDKALGEYHKAWSLNSNHAGFLAEMSGALILLGDSSEAIKRLEQAKHMNPQYPEWFNANLGWAYYHAGQYDNALETLNSLNDPPGVIRIFIAANYARLDRIDDARDEVARILELEPGFNLEKLEFLPFKNEADRSKLAGDLRKAGLPK